MFLKRENDTFWNTPGSQVMASSDKFFVPPQVLQIIDDLDDQLVGLKPVSIFQKNSQFSCFFILLTFSFGHVQVKEKMRRYAAQMLVHKIRT